MDVKLILHPTDGSESADKALEFACDLAEARGARLIVLHVQKQLGRDVFPPELIHLAEIEHFRASQAELFHNAAKRIADDAADKARKRVPKTDVLVVEGDPAHEIVAMARNEKADLIVMGSRGLGDLQGLLLGSVSHKVAHAAPCTCIVVR